MQAHTLGEVGNLGTVSLRVSSGTILPIFIEIGSYLTDKESKISWHSFFETRCISKFTIAQLLYLKNRNNLHKICRDFSFFNMI